MYDKLNDNQAGFRKGYSTTDHIFTLHSLIELLKSRKKKLYCCFIDFSQAFDSVWRIGLWRKLLETSVNGKFFRIVLNMYNNIKSSISVNGVNSAFFACECGVHQGENLSPLLFALYLNILEFFLRSHQSSGINLELATQDIYLDLQMFVLLYADDTVLIAESPEELQNSLHIFSEYCKEWKLNINISKTKVLVFGARRTHNLHFTLTDSAIEIVDCYKYLGVYFSQSHSFLRARKHVTEQAKKAMNFLFTRINNLDIPIDLQLKMFDYTVVPILTYGCEIWGYENTELIEKVQNDFLRKITGSKKSTALYMLYGELGRMPLQITIKTRIIGYWNRLLQGRQFKLSYLLYQFLFNSNTDFKWPTYVKNIFIEIGRFDIWQMQGRFQLKSLSAYVINVLTSQYIQKWFSNANLSSKSLTYFSFKTNFSFEKYLNILPKQAAKHIFKYRTGNHKLPVETGRWDGTDLNDRKCTYCNLNEIGDEFHFLLACPHFIKERNQFLKPYNIRRPNMLKFCQLLSTSNENLLRNLSKFIAIIIRVFK